MAAFRGGDEVSEVSRTGENLALEPAANGVRSWGRQTGGWITGTGDYFVKGGLP